MGQVAAVAAIVPGPKSQYREKLQVALWATLALQRDSMGQRQQREYEDGHWLVSRHAAPPAQFMSDEDLDEILIACGQPVLLRACDFENPSCVASGFLLEWRSSCNGDMLNGLPLLRRNLGRGIKAAVELYVAG
jgi:hypothetical protein